MSPSAGHAHGPHPSGPECRHIGSISFASNPARPALTHNSLALVACHEVVGFVVSSVARRQMAQPNVAVSRQVSSRFSPPMPFLNTPNVVVVTPCVVFFPFVPPGTFRLVFSFVANAAPSPPIMGWHLPEPHGNAVSAAAVCAMCSSMVSL